MAGYLGNTPTEVPLSSGDLQDNIVTSAKIVNGTIALADLSATGTASASTFLRGDNSWASAGATAGQVIQVVTATDSTQRTTSSSSFVTASNTLSATITPSSTSNKIFIIVSATGRHDNVGYYTIYRGATDLGAGSNKGLASVIGEGGVCASGAGLGISYLDSPSTTSATTYQLYFRSSAGTAYLTYDNHTSSITLLEIKG